MSQVESHDVFIDSSALFEVFRKNLSSQLINWIKKEKKRLIFSELIAAELMANESEEKVLEDFKKLRQIWKDLGIKYSAWMMMPEEFFKTEIKNIIKSTPLESVKITSKFKSLLSNPELLKIQYRNSDEGIKKSATLWKEKTYQSVDLNAQARFLESIKNGNSNLSTKDISLIIKNYDGPKVECHFLDLLLEQLKCNSITSAQIIQSPARFRFLYTWSCLAELTALGNLLPNSDGSPNAQMLRVDKGNWYDNTIAASATFCEIFLTNDENLIQKCNYLQSKNLIHFTAKRISDILKI
ncbi:hypothetical protein [Silvanigrella aquatica]|uniref:Uncharacterized protein n=1 Tax=Silvanigrella aquatica TaxID=1915309 RepID=A0A1L4CXS0_9BACT|nr:hypothetical protein [Silvanigrella aquatica]APJ02736.1 hypothetical protein AXG55_01860 [Silvanigrella aquatica]